MHIALLKHPLLSKGGIGNFDSDKSNRTHLRNYNPVCYM